MFYGETSLAVYFESLVHLLCSPVGSLVEREGEGFLFLLVLPLHQSLVAFPKLMSADLYNRTHLLGNACKSDVPKTDQ